MSDEQAYIVRLQSSMEIMHGLLTDALAALELTEAGGDLTEEQRLQHIRGTTAKLRQYFTPRTGAAL